MDKDKYRGKRVDNGEWLRDSENIIRRKDWDGKKWTKRVFLLDGYSCNEMPKIENFVEVHPDTVGQYTSYTPRKGKDVYVGDGGVKPNNGPHIWGRYIVKFGRFMHDSHEYTGYYLDWLDAPEDELSKSLTDHGDLGFDMNIHDNDELARKP